MRAARSECFATFLYPSFQVNARPPVWHYGVASIFLSRKEDTPHRQITRNRTTDLYLFSPLETDIRHRRYHLENPYWQTFDKYVIPLLDKDMDLRRLNELDNTKEVRVEQDAELWEKVKKHQTY